MAVLGDVEAAAPGGGFKGGKKVAGKRPASASAARKKPQSTATKPQPASRPQSAGGRVEPQTGPQFVARDYPDRTYGPAGRKPRKPAWAAATGSLHADARPAADAVGRLRSRLAHGRSSAFAECARFFGRNDDAEDRAWARRAVALELRQNRERTYLEALGGKVGGKPDARRGPEPKLTYVHAGRELDVPGLTKVPRLDAEREGATRAELARSHALERDGLRRRVDVTRLKARTAREEEERRLAQQAAICADLVSHAEHARDRRAKILDAAASPGLASRATTVAEVALARASGACARLAAYSPGDDAALTAKLRRQRPSSAPPRASPKKRREKPPTAKRIMRRPGTMKPVDDRCSCCRGWLHGGAVVIPEFGKATGSRRRDFCSYECAKEWNIVCGPVLHRHVRNTLIDLEAGRCVEVAHPPRYVAPGPRAYAAKGFRHT